MTWIESWSGLLFADAALLWLLLALPVVAWLSWRGGSPAVGRALNFAKFPAGWRASLTWVPTLLTVGAFVLAVLALSRPVRRDPLPNTSEGIDILLCIDVSSSMGATDMDAEQSRLDVAKAAAQRFVESRSADRIGLMVFAAYADVLCPPTLDHRALASRIDEVAMVEPGGREDLTGIGTAAARGLRVLAASDALSRVLILLTDGEENVATPDRPEEVGPLAAAQLATEWGLRIHAIAAGSEVGADTDNGGFAALRRMAEQASGQAFAARDAGALDAVYTAIDALETSELDEPDYDLVDLFPSLLWAALGLLLVGELLRSTLFEVVA